MARPGRSDRSDGHPDGSILTGVAANGPGLFWLVVDGSGAAGSNSSTRTFAEQALEIRKYS